MKIGAQMYTVRASCKTTEDFDATLRRLAEMGYRYVQVSGTCEFDPVWLRDRLKEYGLVCGLTHVKPEKILANVEQVFRDHETFGCNYIGIGGTPKGCSGSLEAIQYFADQYLPVAEKIRDMGGKLFYHNHSKEFARYGGKTELEWICDYFPTDVLGFTMDVYWAQHGGADPAAWIRKLKGRMECVHLKDMSGSIGSNDSKMCAVYEGNMDFDAIIKACAEVNTKYAFVEQDDCYGECPFDCLNRSFVNVTSRFPDMK